MISFKQIIAQKIAKSVNLDENEIENYIEIPPNTDMGDYSFPCFKLAKTLKKSPQDIANDIKEKIELDENISEVKIIGGYLNFFVNKAVLVKSVLQEINQKQEKYGDSNIGNGKNIVIDYSHPNLLQQV